MPANPGIKQSNPRLFQSFSYGNHFLHGIAIMYQIEKRQTKTDNKFFANFLANGFDNFYGKTHPVFDRATPTVGTLIDMTA